jgi:hypothetical protein
MGRVRTLMTYDEYGRSLEPREAGHDARVVSEPPVTV